jgi:hypothetical protein
MRCLFRAKGPVIGPRSSGRPARPSAVFSALVQSGIVAHHAAANLEIDWARRNHIGGNPSRTQFQGLNLDKYVDRSLYESVYRPSAADDAGGSRGYFFASPLFKCLVVQ